MESLKLNGKEGHPRLHRIGFRGAWSPRKLVAVATIVGLVVSGLTLVPLPDGAADNGDDGFPDLRFTGGEIRIPREPVAGETISCTVDLENWGDQDAENVTIGLYDGNPYGSIHWTKHEGNPTIDLGGSGDWDDGRVLHASVLYEDGTYKMWYEGSKTGTYERQAIGYATSRDGLNWTKYESNPVLTDQNAEGGITVLRDSDGTYKMWYTSGGGRQIRHAYSDDGIGWTKYPGNPVLSNGNSGQWDSNLATLGSVIKDDDYYRMWYVGMDPGNIQKVGYATSPDGINWTKYMDNPVLNAGGGGAWDGDGVHFPRVLKVGSQYHMWYTGANGTWPWLYCIGHAVSQDGIEWTKNTGNPLLEKGTSGSWDDASVYSPSVLIQGTTSLMWFSGVDQQKASDGNHYERIGFASGNIGGIR